MSNIELLAPAGNMDALKAAVNNGANAVYLGTGKFGARAFAENFEGDILTQAVEYAHLRNVKIFVTLNTLIKESELRDFLNHVKQLYDAQVDALILQDIGMSKIVLENFPDFELHASTQMTAHSLEDVLYLQRMGFKRVVLSRELSFEEINEICLKTKVDIEIFVHGALCVSYSGQCLMSSMIGGRSGNRGRCAQPCRKKYQLKKGDTFIKTIGDHLLSPKDLNTIEKIKDFNLLNGNISLKIEGRMKRAEYVAIVVDAYRKALDKETVSEDLIKDVTQIFNRDFTKGYVFNQRNLDIVNIEKPNNKGVFLGQVLEADSKRKRVKIRLVSDLSKGDGISLGIEVGRVLKNNKPFDFASAGEIVELDFIGRVNRGEKVYKTSQKALLDRAKESFLKSNFKRDIVANVKMFVDRKAILILKDLSTDKVIEVESVVDVQEAQKSGLDFENITKQLKKVDKFPYNFKEVNIEKDEKVHMAIKDFNELRRRAFIKLTNELVKVDRVKRFKEHNFEEDKIERDESLKLNITIRNMNMLRDIEDLFSKIDTIYYKDINTFQDAIKFINARCECIYSFSKITRGNKKLDFKLDKAQVANLGTFLQLENIDNLYLDYSFNLWNSESIKNFTKKNIKRICVPLELTVFEIEDMIKNLNVNLEAIVYGRVMMMITEYCPVGSLDGECQRVGNKKVCKNNGEYKLIDEKQEEFLIVKEENCRCAIYNSKPLNLKNKAKYLYEIGINNFRLDFIDEKKEEIRDIILTYREIINSFEKKNPKLEELNNTKDTNGHYFRGVD